MASQVCQNFHAECEAALNPLINLELHTSYTYQSMFSAFLESEYLEEQVKTIRCLADHLTNLKHLGLPQIGIGEYLFDKLTLQGSN